MINSFDSFILLLLRWMRSAAVIYASVAATLLFLPLGSFAQTVQNVEIDSNFSEYDQGMNIAKAWGDVVVTYGDLTIQADQVEFHRETLSLIHI